MKDVSTLHISGLFGPDLSVSAFSRGSQSSRCTGRVSTPSRISSYSPDLDSFETVYKYGHLPVLVIKSYLLFFSRLHQSPGRSSIPSSINCVALSGLPVEKPSTFLRVRVQHCPFPLSISKLLHLSLKLRPFSSAI